MSYKTLIEPTRDILTVVSEILHLTEKMSLRTWPEDVLNGGCVGSSPRREASRAA